MAMMGSAWRGPLLTAAALAICWPAWALGGWMVGVTGLVVLDLPIRLGCTLLTLHLAAPLLDRHGTSATDPGDAAL